MSSNTGTDVAKPMAATSYAGRTGTTLLGWITHSQAILLIVFLIVLSLAITAIAPRFLQVSNLAVITRQASFVGIVSLGQMVALMAGLIDLSVGSVAGFAGVAAALLMYNTSIDPYICMALGVVVGALIGLVNGFLVTRLRLNAFIATLSMSFIINGAILVVTQGWAIPNMPEKIQWIGKGSLGPIPVPMLIMLGVAGLLAFMLNKTYIGRHILALGGNPDAAVLVGIRVNRLKMLVYVISGSLAALAGVMMLARLASGQPTVGQVWLLPSFAAPILGGTAMSGGVGSTLGTLVGSLIMAVINNGIVMTGMSVYWENVVFGSVLVLAIAMDSLRRQRAR
jgi:ribose transport system permease protein